MREVNIKCLENCEDLFPKKAHDSDVAYDICSSIDITIPMYTKKIIPTGFCIELPVEEDYVWEAQIRPRSGLAAKNSITVLNTPGTIDAGYRGEVKVILVNFGEDFKIKRGDRIAQLIITRALKVKLVPKNELSESDRGTGGFGSTGV